ASFSASFPLSSERLRRPRSSFGLAAGAGGGFSAGAGNATSYAETQTSIAASGFRTIVTRPRCTLPPRAEQEKPAPASSFAFPRHSTRNRRGPVVRGRWVLEDRPPAPARALPGRHDERTVRLRRS